MYNAYITLEDGTSSDILTFKDEEELSKYFIEVYLKQADRGEFHCMRTRGCVKAEEKYSIPDSEDFCEREFEK